MDKDTTKSTFKEYLLPFQTEYLMKQIEKLQLDRYIKKLHAVRFSKLLLFAQLNGSKSLADISLDLLTNDKLKQEIELKSISASQLSRKLRDFDPTLYKVILERLIQQVHREFGFQKGTAALGRIHLIDSSTISLCLTRYRWAQFRNSKSGVKMHTCIIYHENTVGLDKVILKSAKAADKTEMNELVAKEPEALNLFDRAYHDYRVFDDYCRKGTRFVTRLKANSVIHVLEEREVAPESPITREAIVLLGNPGVNQMEHPLRLIETKDRDGNWVAIVTNDMEIGTEELGDVYRLRWQIELFFKWIKQHLQIKRLYGTSANAVYTQIYMALITYCLLQLLQRRVANHENMHKLFKFVQRCWDEPLASMIRKLHGDRQRFSRGRQRYDYERIFHEVVQQYETGEMEHLNDLGYDPVTF